MRRALFLTVLFVLPAMPARAQMSVALAPPVDGGISSSFVAAETEYGAGHRGVDYAVPAGTRVRAAGAGAVTFAGRVADVLAVTIDHGSGIETTYTGLSSVEVDAGDDVEQGHFIGSSGIVHEAPGLHFGVRSGGEYVDPAGLLAAADLGGAIHLAPAAWMPSDLPALGDSLTQPTTVGTSLRECAPLRSLDAPERPPNDNIAVAVAGITSKTRDGVSADIYEHGPELLGYEERDTYLFSYAGTEGPRFHRPYERRDTYMDIRTAAARLRALIRRIAGEHPGRDIDLIAHSQGGIVARTYLTQAARTGGALPHVDHLVTFATPHRGAPGASQVAPLRDRTATGRYLLDEMKDMSDRGLPVPDPTSPAVRQLAPGSDLMDSLAQQDFTYGTRVLALAIPNDPVVPADHALVEGEQGRVVPWGGAGLGGHSAIVTSPVAHGIAYSFLSGRAPTCTTRWDAIGPRVGSLWSGIESSLATAYGVVERTAASTLGPGGVLVYEAARPR